METNQQIQTLTVQPIPQPKNGYKLPVLITVAILTFFVGGVGGYFLGARQGKLSNVTGEPPQTYTQPTSMPTVAQSPKPDETANWNSYSNTKYGYTVKYPQGWEPNRGPGNLTDEELSTQRDIDFYDPSLPGSDPGTGLNIRVNELDANGASKNCSDLSDCFSKTFSWLTESTTINESSISFLGVPALTFTLQRKTELYTQSWKYVYFIFTGNAYNINISTNVTREKEIFEVFDKILSTLMFVIID